MKKLVLAAITITTSLSACSSKESQMAAYTAYLQAHSQAMQAQAQTPPLVKIGIDPDGRLTELVVNQPQQVTPPQQIKNDESLAFWGQILGATIPTVATLGSSWISGHYNYKNNQAMWGALGNGGFGGIQVGGDATITGSGNRADITSQDGSLVYAADFMNSPSVPGWESSLATGNGSIVSEAAPEPAPEPTP